jgi:hypothetical protein
MFGGPSRGRINLIVRMSKRAIIFEIIFIVALIQQSRNDFILVEWIILRIV